MTDQRIEALEIKMAHHERMLDDLNATLTAQWAAMDALARRLAHVTERLAEAETRASDPVPNQRPPHF